VIGSNSLALSPILTDVAHSLSATPVQVARANAAYGGATALSALLLGPVVDRFSPRRILAAGFAVMTLAMLASAAAASWAMLAAAQGLTGLAAGIVLPATYAYATTAAPPGREAETMGRVLAGWSISVIAGVPLSAFIAGTAGWRASYVLLGMLLAAVYAGFLRLRQLPAATRASAGGMSLLPALRTPGVPALLVVCFAYMTAFYGVYAYLGDHLRQVLGVSSSTAGLVVLAYGLGFGLAGFGDRMVDRVGPLRLLPMTLGALSLVYGLMIPATSSLAALIALAFCWGVANHFGQNIIVLLLGRASEERRGAVLALNSAVSYAGALVGAGLFGAVYEWGGFLSVAALAAGCLAGALAVTVTARVGQAPDKANAASYPRERPETA
jgi:predicted MFS family arabinose efflux permease